MWIFLDALLLLVFLFCAARGWHRGLVGTVWRLAHFLLALVLAVAVGELLAPFLSRRFAVEFTAMGTYLLGFLVIYVGLIFPGIWLKRAVQLPMIRQCDKLLGTVLGAFLGWLAVSALASVCYAAIRLWGDLAVYNNSVILRLAHETNLFGFVADHMI